VIPLSEHVDYWNDLGWKDPFSAALFSVRQQQYGEPYTPQMVVDGGKPFVGSDSRTALRVIAEAAKAPKANVNLRCAANPLALEIRIDSVQAGADVLLAISEDGLQSNVTRGENRGRLMTHTAVTRSLTVAGRTRKGQPFAANPKIVLDQSWKRDKLSAVVFLQDRATHRVLGASHIAMTACPAN